MYRPKKKPFSRPSGPTFRFHSGKINQSAFGRAWLWHATISENCWWWGRIVVENRDQPGKRFFFFSLSFFPWLVQHDNWSFVELSLIIRELPWYVYERVKFSAPALATVNRFLDFSERSGWQVSHWWCLYIRLPLVWCTAVCHFYSCFHKAHLTWSEKQPAAIDKKFFMPVKCDIRRSTIRSTHCTHMTCPNTATTGIQAYVCVGALHDFSNKGSYKKFIGL